MNKNKQKWTQMNTNEYNEYKWIKMNTNNYKWKEITVDNRFILISSELHFVQSTKWTAWNSWWNIGLVSRPKMKVKWQGR